MFLTLAGGFSFYILMNVINELTEDMSIVTVLQIYFPKEGLPRDAKIFSLFTVLLGLFLSLNFASALLHLLIQELGYTEQGLDLLPSSGSATNHLCVEQSSLVCS